MPESFSDRSNGPSLVEVGVHLKSVVRQRWLFPEEIFVLLCFEPHQLGLELSRVPSNNPMSGQLYIFNEIPGNRYDSYSWAKKKSQGRIQETYMNLRINGVDMIRGIYCKGSENPNFRRRVYRFIKAEQRSYSVVHYREYLEEEKLERPVLHPLINFFLNQKLLPKLGFSDNSQKPLQSQEYSNKSAHADESLEEFLGDWLENQESNEEENKLARVALGNAEENLFYQQSSYSQQTVSSSRSISSQSYQPTSPALNHPVSLQSNPYIESSTFNMRNVASSSILIKDIAPSSIYSLSKDLKFLICFNQPPNSSIRLCLTASNPTGLPSNKFYVQLDFLNEYTFRGYYPPQLASQRWIITVLNSWGQEITPPTCFIDVLEFPPSIPLPNIKSEYPKNQSHPPITGQQPFYTQQFPNQTFPLVPETNTLTSHNPPSRPIVPTLTLPSNLSIDPPKKSGSARRPLEQTDYNNVDREHKIRIVEKLGHVKYALEGHENSHSLNSLGSFSSLVSDHKSPKFGMEESPYPSHPRTTDSFHNMLSPDQANASNMHWLEDSELSKLSNNELESLMENYIMTVVQELVQYAALDEDLKAEIDALDDNGLNLLHYCSLYNLLSLIPILITRGAQIDQRTQNGSTALHLAISAGNEDVVRLLIENNADINILDDTCTSPLNLALNLGNEKIIELLGLSSPMICNSQRSLSTYHTPRSDFPNDLQNSTNESNGPLRQSQSNGSLVPPNANNRVPNNKLLYDAFASLSLTDKCALTLSMGQRTLIGSDPNENPSKPNSRSNSLNIPFSNLPSNGSSLAKNNTLNGFFEQAEIANEENDEDISDMQSVISETDKVSLGKALAMMGQTERQQVEEEIKKIQNNVRGWLLRKNYVMLRDAAKSLQSAWRERRRSNSLQKNGDSSAPNSSRIRDSYRPSTDSSNMYLSNENLDDSEIKAITTLQAATRRMIARKSFESLKKQAMASIMIQKNLVRWWTHSKNQNPLPPPPSYSPSKASSNIRLPSISEERDHELHDSHNMDMEESEDSFSSEILNEIALDL